MKIRREREIAKTAKPEIPSQGAWRLSLPCLKSSPKEGSPLTRPPTNRNLKIYLFCVVLSRIKSIIGLRFYIDEIAT